jgi:hypothetical protein
MNNSVIDRMRREMTLHHPHMLLPGERCIYCEQAIDPKLFPNGKTRHLDHFIPAILLIVLKTYHPALPITSYLLPCCSRCNNIANDYVFSSVADKHDYIRCRLRLSPRNIGLALAMPDILLSLIRPIEVLRAGRDWIVRCPQRIGSAWRLDEKVVSLCNSETHYMAPSKMVS